MTYLLRSLWRRIVPVVSTDERRVISALAEELPAGIGEVLLAQLEHVSGRPTALDRGYQYTMEESAVPLAALTGITKLGVVDVCYYQQVMPFVVHLRNGLLFSVTTQEPMPLSTPREEYEVLRVALAPELLTLVQQNYSAPQPVGQRDCRGVLCDDPVVPARQRVT